MCDNFNFQASSRAGLACPEDTPIYGKPTSLTEELQKVQDAPVAFTIGEAVASQSHGEGSDPSRDSSVSVITPDMLKAVCQSEERSPANDDSSKASDPQTETPPIADAVEEKKDSESADVAIPFKDYEVSLPEKTGDEPKPTEGAPSFNLSRADTQILPQPPAVVPPQQKDGESLVTASSMPKVILHNESCANMAGLPKANPSTVSITLGIDDVSMGSYGPDETSKMSEASADGSRPVFRIDNEELKNGESSSRPAFPVDGGSKMSLIGDEDSKLSSLVNEDSKMSDLKDEDSKMSELKDEDSKMSELKDEDSKMSELKDEDSKLSEPALNGTEKMDKPASTITVLAPPDPTALEDANSRMSTSSRISASSKKSKKEEPMDTAEAEEEDE